MSVPPGESDSREPQPIFPISEEAVRQTIDFFHENPDERHREVLREMIVENRGLIDIPVHIVEAWELNDTDAERRTTGGFFMTYKLLQLQSKASGQNIPVVEEGVISAFAEDLNQESTAEPKNGLKGVNLFIKPRMDQIEEDDPRFMEFLRLLSGAVKQTEGVDASFYFLFGALLAYGVIKKQVNKDELDDLMAAS